jgi:PadR family transcriptional regulator, regulatory protein PadR
MLGTFEYALVTAMISLKENAYGVTIRQRLESLLAKPVAIGAVYTTLARLEDKGFVSSYMGEPTPERGGRSKRYYRLEAAGQAAFAATLAEHDRLRHILPPGSVPA